MRVVVTREALADLDEIGRWIARDDPGRADRFVDALERRCAALSRHPKCYPVVHVAGSAEIRKRGFRRYLIFFRVGPNRVDILRVVHGARDWTSLFEDEN